MEVSGPQSCGEHAFHLPHGDHAGHLLRPADIQPFAQGQGNIENHSNLRNCIFVPLLVENAIVDETGACNFSFHALRHAAASLFIKQTWPPKKIQALLGHCSITMTMDVYGHLFESPEDDVDLLAKMELDLLVA